MANTIKIKHSNSTGVDPSTNLSSGELGINTVDSKVWVGNGSSNVELTDSFLRKTGGDLTGPLSITGADNASSKLTLTNTSGTDNTWGIYPNYNNQDLKFLADSTLALTLSDTGSATFEGNINATGGTLTGALTGTSATFSGVLTAGTTNYQIQTSHSGGNDSAIITRAANADNKHLEFRAKNANYNQLFLSTTGRVGIGDNGPDYTLDVAGTFRATGVGIFGGALEASSGKFTTTNNQVTIFSGGTQYGYWNQNIVGFKNAAGVVRTDGPSDLKLQTNSTDRLTIHGSTGAATFSGALTGTTGTFTSNDNILTSNTSSASSAATMLWFKREGTNKWYFNLNADDALSIGGKLTISTAGAATFSGTVNANYVVSTNYAQASSLRIPSTTNYHEIWNSGDELRIYRNQSAAIRIGASNLATFSGAVSLAGGAVFALDSGQTLHAKMKWNGAALEKGFWSYGYYGFEWETRTGANALVIRGDTNNVGIGTSAPDQKLHVNGTARVTGNLYLFDTGAANYLGYREWRINTAASGGALIRNDGDGGISLQDGSTTALFVGTDSTYGGKVGIGTTSPGQKLDVVGRIRSYYNAGDYFEIGSSDSGGFVVGKSGGVEKVNFRTYGNSFFTGGNVGIGHTAPTAPLTVLEPTDGAGTIAQFFGRSQLTAYNAVDIRHNWGRGILALQEYTTTKVYISSWEDSYFTGGNVGIGTTSPGATRLNVLTNLNNNVAAQFENSHATGSYGVVIKAGDDSGNYALSVRNKDNGELMRVLGDGKVGIGTAAPSSLLTLRSQGVNPILASLRSGTSTSEQFKIVQAESSAFTTGRGTSSGIWANIIESRNSNLMLTTFLAGGTGGKIILDADNVGIGTTAPTNIFHVYSPASAMIKLESATGNNDIGIDFYRGTAHKWQIRNNGNDDNFFIIPASANDADAAFTIKQDGKVGIGHITPGYALDIRQAAGDVYVQSNTGTNRAGFQTSNTGGTSYFYRDSSSGTAVISGSSAYATVVGGTGARSLHLGTNGTVKATILSDGSVGIGTSAPHTNAKLDVNGNILMSGNATTRTIWNGGYGGGIQLLRSDANDTRWAKIGIVDNTGGFVKGITVLDSGNVGIGTETPGEKLDVNGKIQIKGGNWLIFRNSNNSNYGSMRGASDTSNDVTINTNGEVIRFKQNGQVGIGTTAPTEKLHVSSGSILMDSDWGLKFGGSNAMIEGNSSGTILRFNASAGFKFTDGGTTQVAIDTNGKVGIGETDPDVLLKLNYGGDDPAGTTTRVGAFSLEGAHITLDAGVNTAGSGTAWMQTRHKDVSANPTAYYPLIINPLGGNVGVGTTSPRVKLDLGGTGVEHMRWGTWSGLGEESSHYSLVIGSNVYVNGSATKVRSTSSNGYRAIKMKYNAGITFHAVNASVTGGDALGNERMRIQPDGNVGIGTDAPAVKLDVYGSLNLRSEYNLTWGGTAGADIPLIYGKSGSGGHLAFHSQGTDGESMRIDANGNVGIGTTAPTGTGWNANALTVHAYQNDAHGAIFRAESSSTSLVAAAGNALATIGTLGAHSLKLFTNGNANNGIVILSDGKVGIGTAAPGASLDIKGNTNTWAGMAKIYLTDTSGNTATRNWSIGNGGTGWGDLNFIVSNAKDGVPADTTGTAALVLKNDGKVGIGTTAPGGYWASGSNLVINGSTNVGMTIASGTSHTGAIAFADGTSGSAAYKGRIEYNHDDDKLYLGAGGATQFVLDEDGKVGIGTAAPEAKFHVNNGTNLNTWIRSNGTEMELVAANDAANTFTPIQLGGSTIDLATGTSSLTKRLQINVHGEVGIGTAAPATTLDVNGITTVRDYIHYKNGSTSSGLIGSSSKVAASSTPDADLAIRSSGAMRFIVSNDWANPKLVLAASTGNATFSGQTTFTDDLYITTDQNIHWSGNYSFISGNGANTTGHLKFYTSDLPRLTIKGDGNVGIGTAAPNAILDISDATNDNLRIGTRGGNMNLFSVTDAGAGAPLAFEGTQFHFVTGNVGIGTTSPGNWKLYVNGDTYVDGDAAISGGIQSGTTTPLSNLGYDLGTTSLRWNGLYANTGSFTGALTGTSATFSGAIRLDGDQVLEWGGTKARIYGSNTGDYLKFKTDDEVRMTIDSSGNCGIGTTNPSGYKLFVEGHTRFTGLCDVAINTNTNLRVNGATHAGETWDGAIHIKNSSAIGNETSNEAVIYAEGGELKCMDDDRNRTTLSSHEDGKWVYKSNNTKTGKSVTIRMEELVAAVEAHLGVSFSEIVEGE